MTALKRSWWYFLSSIGVSLLGVAAIPLFTARLGPEHFGVFAVGAALAGVVSGISGSMSTVSLAAEWGSRTESERKPYVTTILFLSLVVGVIASSVVFGLYTGLSETLLSGVLTPSATILSSIAAILNGFSAICAEILTVDGRAKAFAVVSVLQTLANVVAVSVAVFVFGEINLALFWGFFAAAIANGVASAIALRGSLQVPEIRTWLPVASRGGFATVISSLGENGRTAIERWYLSAIVGVSPLGLFVHAQYYKNVSMIFVNALSRGVWPSGLQEARAVDPSFPETIKLWKLAQLFVVLVAVAFALLGRDIIGLITHNKFVGAAPYAVDLLVVLLLQTIAKPHSLMLMSRGQGHLSSYLHTASSVVALIWVVVSAPFLGIWAAVSGAFIQVLTQKIGIVLVARRLCRFPFTDGWILASASAILVCQVIVEKFGLSIQARSLVAAVVLVVALWRARAGKYLTSVVGV